MEDQDLCNLIALSVGSVMRQSLDDGFKEECKKLLGVTNTQMVQEKLCEKLMEVLQKKTGQNSVQQHQDTVIQSNHIMEGVLLNTAVSIPEDHPQIENATIAKFQQNITLSEMYCQTIKMQKRRLSPQPESRSGKNHKPSSAPF